jgi:endonuclease/exonuclease/phosphatase family metal-dependent hydrolase
LREIRSEEVLVDMWPLRVMSFNIRGSFRDFGKVNAWENRAVPNVETIERHTPTLIGFQELQSGNLETYNKRLSGYGYVLGPRAGNKAPHEFNAIFFDKGQLELLDSGGFWLSETPEQHSASWRTRSIRCANWAVFRHLNAGFSFLHLNTHLDHLSRTARVKGSTLILRRMADIQEDEGTELPVILTGDFNCAPASTPYRNLVKARFVDTYLAASNEGFQGAHTFHAFEGPWHLVMRCGMRPRRIDWILLKDHQGRIRIRSHLIIRDYDEESGIYPSDHYPVLAEITLVR